MKRFLFFTSSVTLLSSFILLVYLKYDFIVIAYHLLIMCLLNIFIYIINVAVTISLSNNKIRAFLINIINATFFFLLFQFYLLVLGSNFFWRKTITVSILKNYFLSLNEFIGIMPVEKWIIIIIAITYISILVVLFYYIRPKPGLLFQSYKHLRNASFFKKSLLAGAFLLIGILVFNHQLWYIKRKMHFAEEPLLEFTLGAMWGGENSIAFDKTRYENGLKDKKCMDSIKINNSNDRTVVVILIDALRSDHLSFYGYNRKTTPFLDSLYNTQHLQFVKNAFSPSTMTMGGISGMFFSRDWNEFGFNGLNLMNFLKKTGYTTYAFLTGFHRDWYGLSALYRGSCDYYYESSKNPEVKNDDDLITLEQFNKTPIKKKSFVYIHLLSVHTLGKKNEPFRKFLPDKIGFNTSKKSALINNYDNGILQADFVISKVFEKLKKENLLNNATVFVLADHGELFGENSTWGHGGNVQENLISVPWLIFDNNLSWYNNLEAATLKDVAPTIADKTGSPVPSCWEGTSLHYPPHNFTLPINSVEAGDYPYGKLIKDSNTYRLEIMNNNYEIKKEVVKSNGQWHTTMDHINASN